MNSKLAAGALFIIIIAMVYLAGSINLPLPEGIPETAVAESQIQSCEIKEPSGGKHSTKLFVGITAQDPNVPYLRWNPEEFSIEKIKAYCKERVRIKVLYKAQRLLLRPKVTYWIQELDVQTNS